MEQAQHGFTLLELLVVMAIIGILTAIAVPQYGAYKRRAFDARARSELYSAALAEEAHFLDTEQYLSCQDNGCAALPGISRVSNGVRLTMTAGEQGFTGTAQHAQGTGKIFRWDSLQGGMQE
ncbi:MAG: type II secretion system protein [Proteobacteria bacterium]|nr:type II secretion system protein [Pseudomonadota bacterium]